MKCYEFRKGLHYTRDWMKPYVDRRKQKTDWYGKYVFYIPLDLHWSLTTDLFLRNIANNFTTFATCLQWFDLLCYAEINRIHLVESTVDM